MQEVSDLRTEDGSNAVDNFEVANKGIPEKKPDVILSQALRAAGNGPGSIRAPCATRDMLYRGPTIRLTEGLRRYFADLARRKHVPMNDLVNDAGESV